MKFFFNILLIYFFLVGNSFSKMLSINDDFKNVVEQLEKLNDLYKSDVLTKEEFEKAKKRILD